MKYIKWIRKNRTKFMAILVVFLMVSFLGVGTFLQYLTKSRGSGKRPIAHFGLTGTITAAELGISARTQLQILRMLQADKVLRGQRELQAFLLAELLFPDPKLSSVLNRQIKIMAVQKGLRISPRQLNKFFAQAREKNELYWLLLKAEAKQAGLEISREQSRQILASIVPQVTGGYGYSEVIGAMVKQGISEDTILETFGDLLEVWTYSRRVTSIEDVTSSQLMHIASRQFETIDVEFVKFDSADFVDERSEFSESELIEQFEKYKSFLPGAATESNPYGFGYKLPERVKLEYIAVKLDDISKIVTPPKPEEAEQYYQNNRNKPPITYTVPSDPNDPNSAPVQRIKSYAEVADVINETLLKNKINTKAERILSEAKGLIELKLEDVDVDKLSDNEFGKLVADYKTIGREISEKYNLKIYTGRSGLLSAKDVINDKYLGTLFAQGQSRWPVQLVNIIFAIEQLGVTQLGPFDVPKPRMYENIGPLRDSRGEIIALVRIIEAQKSVQPKDINETYDKTLLRLDETEIETKPQFYSVKESVLNDLRKLSATDSARAAAEKFVKELDANDWDNAIEQLNQVYGTGTAEQAKAGKTFKLQSLTDLHRLGSLDIRTFVKNMTESPVAESLVNERIKTKKFIEQLYRLLPEDSNSLANVPVVMEYKPYASYYVIKNLSRNLLSQQQYDITKCQFALMEESLGGQSLAIVHFMPENILKRMKFRWNRDGQETTDVNETADSNGEY